MKLSDTLTWRDVKGYEGLYYVSNMGDVKNKNGRAMKQRKVKGYNMVNLTKNGVAKGETVSRLVAKAFIPNPYNKKEVNHIDENKLNNHVSNLEWVTPKENSNHGTRNKRIADKIKKLHDNGHYEGLDYERKGKGQGKGRGKKPVKMIDLESRKTLKEFKSVSEANLFFGKNIKNGSISDACRGNLKTYLGYKWEYA